MLPIRTQLIEVTMKTIPGQSTIVQHPSSLSRENRDAREIRRLHEELPQQREETAELRGRFAALTSELEQNKIDSFGELPKQDKEAKKVLIELVEETAPGKTEGFHVPFFGLTSTGKSAMLNALLGQNLAKTGAGEMTLNINSYSGTGYTMGRSGSK